MTQTDTLAVQLYSLRELDLDFGEKLAYVAAAGYAGVETVGDHNLSADEMKEAVEAHGLRVCSSHVPLNKLEEDVAGVSRFNLAVGNDTLVLPSVPRDLYDDSARSWLALGERLGRLSERCRGEGCALLYHNHDFEMREVEGKLALELLLEGAEGTPLGLEPDLAWMVRGGQDPLELLERFTVSCPRAHIKDIAPEGENLDEDGWSDVGHGTLDWSELLPAVRKAGAQWFVVEHDAPKDPLGFLKRSAAFLADRL